MNSKDALSLPTLKKKGTHNGMRQKFRNVTICLALTAIGAFSQTKPSFEVATIKPSQPKDRRARGRRRRGPHGRGVMRRLR